MILSPHDPNLAEALLDARFARRWLAEGDSWFSLGGFTGNLLMALDDDRTLIVNCAHPGDTLAEMGGDACARLLEPDDGVPRWDAVLLSGGGNDLLGRCREFIRPDPADPVDDDALLETLSDIEGEIVRLLRLVTATQPGVPVLCHTYDYPPVSRRWWWWQAGPWVAPALRAAGLDRSRWDGFAGMLIDALAERLKNVAADYRRLGVVETRGRLLRQDWRNEIHPNTTGYAEHAIPWRRALAALHPQPKEHQ